MVSARNALGGVDRARIAQTGGVADVVGGQPHTEPTAVMSNLRFPFLPIPVMVQRSLFLTQSVAVRRVAGRCYG